MLNRWAQILFMKILKKALRVLALSFLIVLAASGLGIFGVVSFNSREKYMDKEIRIEQTDKSRDEEDDVCEDKNWRGLNALDAENQLTASAQLRQGLGSGAANLFFFDYNKSV